MQTVDHILGLLGGSAEIARETGFPISTIESWRAPNFIPSWRREPLLRLAASKSVALSTADFPERERRHAPQQVAA